MRSIITFFILLVLAQNIIAQDVIITNDNKKIDGEITKIENGKLELVMGMNNSKFPISLDRIGLIILNEGYYLSPKKMKEGFTLQKFIELNQGKIGVESHIIDAKGNIIQATDFTEKIDEVDYFDPRTNQVATISKSNVLCTISKGEETKLLKDEAIVVESLSNISFFNYETADKTEVVESAVNTDDAKEAEKDKGLVDNVEKEVKETKVEVKDINEPVEIENVIKDPILTEYGTINGISKEEYKKKALDKVNHMGQYLAIISDKNADLFDKDKAMESAILLFINESATVEVSNVNTGKIRTHKIRSYLELLKDLNYDKVTLEWSDIGYVSNFRLGPKGNYWGTVSIKQKFTGYRDGIPIYQDITEKEVEVMLKGYKKVIEGELVNKWDVLLANIGVTVTKYQ